MDQFPHDTFEGLAAEDPARNRSESRDSLFLMADLRVAGSATAQQVRVRNLSTGGLMAELPTGLPQGVEVEVDVRGIGWVTGHIAWSAAGRVGIAFVSPIDPMMARKPVSGAAKGGVHIASKVFVKPLSPRR
ncbi:PilZ domain-containing protein [Sphingomonas sp. PB4P5]|uniref:PilZ domain-containing protein n=1 Tax=Parasphingomonas puruogangriensis TaxID=3096155 RepID=UPI002FCB7B47